MRTYRVEGDELVESDAPSVVLSRAPVCPECDGPIVERVFMEVGRCVNGHVVRIPEPIESDK